MCVLQVNEQQLKKQLDEITYIIKLRDNLTPKAGTVRVTVIVLFTKSCITGAIADSQAHPSNHIASPTTA